MAYRKVFRRPKRSRRTYRRRRKSLMPLAVFPRSAVRKATIVKTAAFTGTTGALGGLSIKITSLNDPMTTVGDNLPLGLDEMNRLYASYRILGAKVSVVGHPVTITGGAICGLHITESSALLTSVDYYRELKGTVSRMVSPDIDIFKCAIKYSPKVIFKLKDVNDTEDLKGSLTGTGSVGAPAPADPAKNCYIHFFV